ncbi:protein of unknown function [Pustulibacterium marinum]|uniref:Nucleotide modification associated domain-containing protein n=2 Tax=Pustulibacterium marinum TaxID=1224947 RepID=A0A1I7FE55_9FLAO|nr:protein of unknown function [Pustulibacterium marinum]
MCIVLIFKRLSFVVGSELKLSILVFEHLKYLSEIYGNLNETMQKTSQQYDEVIAICRQLFMNKMKDYGCAWRILRLPSLTDQIFIKAQRIRSLQENEVRKVDEDESSEFIGIINYSIMALIQLEKGVVDQPDLDIDTAAELYDKHIGITKTLMENKNHDYGEAWREMRISSLTDLILQKLLRVKQIEDNKGKTIVSEGIDANYQDMINYSVFALILMKEQTAAN